MAAKTKTPKAGGTAVASEASGVGRMIELLLSALGLYASFLTWGYMQEKLTSSVYVNTSTGEEAKWKFSYVMNTAMSACAFVLGWAAYRVELRLRPAAAAAASQLPPSTVYLVPALSNSLASPIGYMSLRYINFPMMLLAKSCKLVPVMFMGWLLNGERYKRSELVAVGCISVGVALFTIKPKDMVALGLEKVAGQFLAPEKLSEALAAGAGDDSDSLGRRLLGLALVSTNLLFDGFTNTEQKRLNDQYKTKENGAPSPFFTMYQMNGWSVVLMGAWLAADCGLGAALPGQWREAELTAAARFVATFPQVWPDLALFSLANAVGQLFIFYIIRAFSPVVLVTLTVTRKFFSILVSIIRFGHEVYPWQYGGMAVLFTGLALGDALKLKPKGKEPKQKAKEA